MIDQHCKHEYMNIQRLYNDVIDFIVVVYPINQ